MLSDTPPQFDGFEEVALPDVEEEEEPPKIPTASKSKRRKEIGVQNHDKVPGCLAFSVCLEPGLEFLSGSGMRPLGSEAEVKQGPGVRLQSPRGLGERGGGHPVRRRCPPLLSSTELFLLSLSLGSFPSVHVKK